jgi:hypothetical protein
MRHNAEIPYAQQEEYCPVKLFRFENEHLNKSVVRIQNTEFSTHKGIEV